MRRGLAGTVLPRPFVPRSARHPTQLARIVDGKDGDREVLPTRLSPIVGDSDEPAARIDACMNRALPAGRSARSNLESIVQANAPLVVILARGEEQVSDR
jgi:hypothetical protein